MPTKQTVIVILQLCVLIVLGIVLYRLSIHEQWIPTAMSGDMDEDDMHYKPIVAVGIGSVVKTTLRSYLDVYGTVEPQPARPGMPPGGASVNSPTPALVASVDVVEGQHVKAGQPLFRLDDRAASAAIARAKLDAESAERTAKEFDDALQSKSVPLAQVLRARATRDAAKSALAAAEAQQATLIFTAPIDGVVSQLRIHAGESTPINLPAVELVDPDRLVVALQVPQWQLHGLKVGDPAIVGASQLATTQPTTEPALQPATQPATNASITYIDPQIDPRTGLGQVDVSVPPGGAYRVGQFVSLRIVAGQHDDCLAVPVSSIVQDGKGNATLSVVQHEYRWAARRIVQLGFRENGLVEVRDSDLKAGQSVVTTGSYALSDQCQIEVTLQ